MTAADAPSTTAHADLVRLDRLGPALATALGDERWTAATATLIAGGKSNLTFFLRCPAGSVVLRRPPAGPLLPSAHDMGREARVQKALAGTPVPVAPVVLEDTTGDLIGVPFYVMQEVPGRVVRDELPAGYADTEEDRRRIGEALLDTLVAVHAVDQAAVGLGDFGRPEGFLARQMRRWQGQSEASRTVEVPDLDRLAAGLADAVPESPAPTIVHGDFRLDNCLLAPDDPGTVAAVLDWELSTLGDPLTDLALLLFYWREAGERQLSLTPTVTQLPGFPTREQLIERYAERSGRDVAELDWYRAFAHFKFAVIAQGIAARVAAGSMAGQDFGDLDEEIRQIAADGVALLPSGAAA